MSRVHAADAQFIRFFPDAADAYTQPHPHTLTHTHTHTHTHVKTVERRGFGRIPRGGSCPSVNDDVDDSH